MWAFLDISILLIFLHYMTTAFHFDFLIGCNGCTKFILSYIFLTITLGRDVNMCFNIKVYESLFLKLSAVCFTLSFVVCTDFSATLYTEQLFQNVNNIPIFLRFLIQLYHLHDLLNLDKTAFFSECMFDVCVYRCICYIFALLLK